MCATYDLACRPLSGKQHLYRLLAVGLLLSITFFSLALIAQTTYAFSNPIVYVNHAVIGGTNDGSSWANAYADLQDALATANAGAEIWVAQAIYSPGPLLTDTFKLVPDVRLLGGFAATETVASERDWVAHPTILSGDIDSDDITVSGVVTDAANIVGDNNYHVVFAEGTLTNEITATTVIDGFTITAGAATGPSLDSSGGGMSCGSFNAITMCSPTIQNVTFSGNYALDSGGGLHNFAHGINSEVNPLIIDVLFTGNHAARHGGGMFNYSGGSNVISGPRLNNVIFENNRAGKEGGGLCNYGSLQGKSSPHLENVVFLNNGADIGGGMSNIAYEGSTLPVLKNVDFHNNSAANGGGMATSHFFGGVLLSLTDVNFIGNDASDRGGAMYNNGQMPYPWDENGRIDVELTRVVIAGNQALLGGGLYDAQSQTTVTDSVISGNSADRGGGILTNTNRRTSLTINNSVLSGNRTTAGEGNAVFSTFGKVTINNSIIWNNGTTLTSTLYAPVAGSEITATHSLIEWSGGSGDDWVGQFMIDDSANLDTDPLFVSPIVAAAPTATGDLRLTPGSPAINRGNNDLVSILIDLDGNYRIQNNFVDLGPFEEAEWADTVYFPLVIR